MTGSPLHLMKRKIWDYPTVPSHTDLSLTQVVLLGIVRRGGVTIEQIRNTYRCLRFSLRMEVESDSSLNAYLQRMRTGGLIVYEDKPRKNRYQIGRSRKIWSVTPAGLERLSKYANLFEVFLDSHDDLVSIDPDTLDIGE